MNIDLDTLKSDILHFLETSDFAVFRSYAGGLEGVPMVTWDCERFPDHQMFLDTARKSGASMILFAAREFEASEIEEKIEELELCELTREERRDYERRLRAYRNREGITCTLELAFDHHGRMYVYEVQPDWYEEFRDLCDEIAVELPAQDDPDEEPDALGGFYSNN